MTIVRSYSEMLKYETFEDRYEYLKLGGSVGHATFGFDRYINQSFYHSAEWRSIRQHVIIRDNGCDLAVRGYEINGSLLIHHINPMESDDIVHDQSWVLEPEFLITTTQRTHNAIHYGDRSLLPAKLVERRPGDTRLW
jgi:hypothetical protein